MPSRKPCSAGRRNAAAVSLGLLAMLALATVARADLDVGFPPGTPLDWFATIPQKSPTRGVTVPLTPEEKDKEKERERNKNKAPDQPAEGQTGSRPADKPQDMQPADLGTGDTLAYARIVTPDIVWHLKWTGKRPPYENDIPAPPKEKKKPDKTVTGGGTDKPNEPPPKWGPPVESDCQGNKIEYPPVVGNDSYWLSAAMFLRKLLHPELTSKAESLHYLIMMAEPSLCSLTAVANDNATDMKDWLKQVKDQVKGMPGPRPQPLTGQTPEETMLLRLAAEDLTAGYVTAADTAFGKYLYQLEPHEVVPLCERYLEDKETHRFLRRNACAALTRYTGERVNQDLIKLLSDEDGVVRERALDALVRRQELETIAYLETMSQTQGYLKPLALFGLGMIGDAKCSKTILRALKERDDPDILWAAIPAAARCQYEKNDEAIAALKDLSKWLVTTPNGTFAETNPDTMYIADPPPDAPMTRLVCIQEMTAVALARLGDEDARKIILKAIDGTPIRDVGDYKGMDNKTRNTHIPTASKETFGTLHGPCLETLLLALAKMGDVGKKRLEIIATDRICEITLRLGALEQLAQLRAVTPAFLEKILVPDERAMVRGRALLLLEQLDEDKARKYALRVITGWDGDLDTKNPIGTEVVAAVRVLSHKSEKGDKIPIDALSKCLRTAVNAAASYKQQGEDKLAGATIIRVRPPVIEEVCRTLGNSGEESATKVLLELAKALGNPGRGCAVAALGGFSSMRAKIVDYLEDDDPWVRFVAYRVLKHKNPAGAAFADWLYEPKKAKRAEAVAKWREWLKGDSAKDKERHLEELVDHAVINWATHDKDKDWPKAKTELKTGGMPVLRRLLEVAGDKAKAESAFAILREVTGETLGDDYDAWKNYLDSKK